MQLIVPYKTPSGAGTGDMLKANNLADVVSAAAARRNLDVMSIEEANGRDAFVAGGLLYDGYNTTWVDGAFPAFGTDDYSIWIKFRLDALNTDNALWAADTGADKLLLEVRSNGHVEFWNGTAFNVAAGIATTKVYDLVITRSGSTLKMYLNGAPIGTLTDAAFGKNETATAYTIGYSNYFGYLCKGSFHRLALFNFCLTDAEVAEVVAFGTPQKYRWGQTSLVTGDNSTFASDLGWWLKGAGVTISGGTANLVSVADGAAALYKPGLLTNGKRYRARFTVSNRSAGGIQVQYGGYSGTTYSADGTYTEDGVCTVNGTFYLTAIGVATLKLDNVTVVPLGAVVDLDLGVGKGTYLPDRSVNNLYGIAQVAGISHVDERWSGHFIVKRYFAHSDISATAGTTKLMDLPPNCAPAEVEFDRESAFDAGTTLDVGIAANSGKYISAQSVASTGKARSSNSSASESATAWTAVYLKKNQATTQGGTTVRIQCWIRGL